MTSGEVLKKHTDLNAKASLVASETGENIIFTCSDHFDIRALLVAAQHLNAFIKHLVDQQLQAPPLSAGVAAYYQDFVQETVDLLDKELGTTDPTQISRKHALGHISEEP